MGFFFLVSKILKIDCKNEIYNLSRMQICSYLSFQAETFIVKCRYCTPFYIFLKKKKWYSSICIPMSFKIFELLIWSNFCQWHQDATLYFGVFKNIILTNCSNVDRLYYVLLLYVKLCIPCVLHYWPIHHSILIAFIIPSPFPNKKD